MSEAGLRDDIKAVSTSARPAAPWQAVPQVAAAVASLTERKPVYAKSSGLMCSAAYWIASKAHAICQGRFRRRLAGGG